MKPGEAGRPFYTREDLPAGDDAPPGAFPAAIVERVRALAGPSGG